MNDASALAGSLELLRSASFEAAFRSHPDAMAIFDREGTLVEANAALASTWNIDPASRPSVRDLPVADPPALSAAFDAAVSSGPQRVLVRGVRAEGGDLVAAVTLVPVVVEGDVVRVVATFSDHGEVFRARERIRAIEERLATTFDSVSDAVYVLDADWRFAFVNRRAEVLVGLSASQLLGRSLWEAFPEMNHSPLGPAYRQAVAERKTTVTRTHYKELDLWLEATAHPMETGLAVYVRDVRDEEVRRIQLEETQQRLAAQGALLDVATDAIIVRDLGHHVVYWNRSASRMYGWTRDEVVGQYLPALLYRDLKQFHVAASSTRDSGHWSGELEQVRRDGTRVVVQSTWTLVRNAAGEPESIFTINTDITERKRQEQMLLRTQRMESLGTLASGIAHDLNNVLTPILMSAQLLGLGETDAGRREIVGAIEAGVKRGSDMVRQVLTFARGVEGRRVPLDVGLIIAELLAFGRDALPPTVALSSNVAPDLWPVEGDPTQLLQVLMNLVTNARDAMPDGGLIRLVARNVSLTDTYASVTHLAKPGDYVHVEVTDTGTGMTKEVADKIFEPFFTTKAQGHGTGLGLATSIAIVRGHGGFMQVYSEPGHGTRFLLHLPAYRGGRPVIDDAGAPRTVGPRGNGELLLVVDDEASIRQITRQSLEAHGYRTIVASNGVEALDVLARTTERVDLVFTDMAMPLMDGATLAAELARTRPAVPIVATSGLNANVGVARARNAGVRRFISKPYTTRELLAVVREALDGKSG